jgi:hypothetical protein
MAGVRRGQQLLEIEGREDGAGEAGGEDIFGGEQKNNYLCREIR